MEEPISLPFTPKYALGLVLQEKGTIMMKRKITIINDQLAPVIKMI